MQYITHLSNTPRVFGKVAIAFVLAVSTQLTGGCSSGSGATNVKIQMPNWNQRRASELQRRSLNSTLSSDGSSVSIVAINVTCGGSDSQTFYWENGGESSAPPSSQTFTIGRGSSCLFQVMAVYDGQTPEFYYGDASQKISSDTDVAISVESVATANSGTSGKISGRYLRANQTGPTGVYQYRFAPPNGNPSMIVTTGEVFSGWMSLFALDSPLIQYTSTDGNPIFPILDNAGQATQPNNSSMAFFRNENRNGVIRIEVPAGYYENERDHDSGPQNAQRFIFGYFGPGSITVPRKICYNSNSTSELSYFYGDSSRTSPVFWKSTAAVLASARIAPVSIAGGAAMQTGLPFASCQDPSDLQYSTALAIDESRLAEGDSVLGFRAPFATLDGNDNQLRTSYNAGASTLNVSWRLLPGVSGDIEQLGVFYRINPSGSSDGDRDIKSTHDGYNCNALTQLAQPFSLVRVPSSSSSFAIPNVTATHATQMQIVVCPFDSARSIFFNSGVSTKTGSSASAALQLEQVGSDAATLSTVLIGSSPSNCYPYHVALRDQFGRLTTSATVITGTASVSGAADLQIYPSNTCSSGGVGGSFGFTLSLGNSVTQTVWLRQPTGSAGVGVASLNFSSATNQVYGLKSFIYSSSPAVGASKIEIQIPDPVLVGRCSPIDLLAEDSASNPATVSSTIDALLTSGYGVFFADALCRDLPITHTVIPANIAAKRIYYIGRSAVANETIAVSSSLNTGSKTFAIGSQNVTGYVVSGLNLLLGSTGLPCSPITVGAVDEANIPVQTDRTETISLTASNSGALFYPTNSCTSGTGSSSATAIINQNSSTSQTLFIAVTSGTNTSITITGQDSAGIGLTPATSTYTP